MEPNVSLRPAGSSKGLSAVWIGTALTSTVGASSTSGETAGQGGKSCHAQDTRVHASDGSGPRPRRQRERERVRDREGESEPGGERRHSTALHGTAGRGHS